MPRPCTVCTHEQREAIDKALVSGEAVTSVQSRYVSVHKMALYRHKDEHLPARLAKAHDAAEVAAADSLLEQVQFLRGRAMTILDRAEADGLLMPALAAIREARGCLELLGKLLGQIDERPQVNLVLAPQWPRLVQGLREVLAPHPAILAQVAAHLLTLEGEATNAR